MQSRKHTASHARRLALLLSTGLLTTLLLAACGGGSDPTPTSAPATTAPAAAAVATNTPEPVPTVEPTTAPAAQVVTGTQSMTSTQAVTGTDTVTGTTNVTTTAAMTATESTTTTAASPAGAQAVPTSITINLHEDAKFGSILVDQAGMTLYLFDKDEVGKSSCTGNCLVKWPPLLVGNPDAITAGEGLTGEFTTIALSDGTYQVVYAGHPLYYYVEDANPGDTTGQAVGEVWWVLDAGGNAVPAK